MNNSTFEDGQLLKVVHIKSPADYPKKDGIYFCCRSGFLTVQELLSDPPVKSFMREINWYLQPIEGIKAEDCLL